jgi:hypothetical protein
VSLPAGGALSLLQCDHDNCGSYYVEPQGPTNQQCLPFCKPLGALDPDAGHACPADPRDAAASDAGAGDICSFRRADPATCEACEARNCPHDPAGCAEGACRAQPACSDYATSCDRNLCTSALNCIRATGCIRSGPEFCYCGTQSDWSACRQGIGADGRCKREIEEGLKSTDPAFIMAHLADPSLPGGGALSLGNCDAIRCSDTGQNECLPYCY